MAEMTQFRSVRDASVRAAVAATDAAKCERCWHYSEDVGVNPAHPEICGRCVSNVDGEGEKRQFA